MKRNGPGDGTCVWCGLDENCDHVLFRCIVARFAWNVLREATGCGWNSSGFADFYRLVKAMGGSAHRLAWVGFAALARSLWTTCNKALIDRKLFRYPADLMYKLVILLQLWKLLASPKDRPHVEQLISRLRDRCGDLGGRNRAHPPAAI